MKLFYNKFSLVYALTIILLVSACSKEPVSYPRAASIPIDSYSSPKTFLALGDSYTIGQSVTVEQRFPYHTVRQLIDRTVGMNQANIIATTGWTTGNLLNSLINNPPANDYDFVSLLIGVNNQYQGRGTDEYRVQFTELLNKAIGYAGGRSNRVFVLSIPDYSVTPFAKNSDTARIAREIDTFNIINRQISDQFKVAYLDITAISREARKDPTLTAPDSLHPSGKQYERWAILLAPIMKASL